MVELVYNCTVTPNKGEWLKIVWKIDVKSWEWKLYFLNFRRISWVYQGMFSTSGDIMMHLGEQVDKSLSSSIENPDVLNTPRRAHDIPPMYSWYPPMYSWYPPDVLMVSPTCIIVSPTCIMISPNVLMISPDVLMVYLQCTEHPRCTHDMPPTYLTPPDVLIISPRCTYGIPDILNTSQSTELTLYRVI